MLKLRIINKPKMYKLKCNFTFPNIILANMQEKEVNPTKEVQEVIPDIQYDGLSKVTVKAVTNEIDENIVPENIKNGVNILGIQGNVIELNGDILNVSPTKNEQEFTPVFPKNGFTKVNILGTKLQNKEVIPTKESQIIVADDDNIGLNQVTVNPIPDEYVIPTGTIDITNNGTYDVTNYESANVNIQPTLQEKTQTITENGSYIFEPDNDYYGLNKVIANVNVPTKTLGPKTITENGTYKASDDGVDGYSEVEVSCSKYAPRYISFRGYKGTDLDYELENLDVSNLTTMTNMFNGCSNLANLILSSFDTSKVTIMQSMFLNCSSLITLDVSNFDTTNVTDMSSMFNGCKKITTIDVSNFNTSNVTSLGMQSMFSGCNKLSTLDVSSFDTTNVTIMSNMFNGCNSLTTLDVSNFNTSNVTDIGSMFQNCSSLTSLNLGNFDASKINSNSYSFSNCENLTNITGSLNNLGQNFDTSKSANYISYQLNLSSCKLLTEQSIINMLNGLYDIATKGCKTQQVVLGSTNLAKLTSTEGQQALTNATAKGWTIS